MTPSQRGKLREELIERLTAIYRRARENLSEETIEQAMRPDPTDGAEESALDELSVLDGDLDDRERRLAHAIEDALRRMRSDSYGICIGCACDIPFQRLRAVPWTLRCADDEARDEARWARPPTL